MEDEEEVDGSDEEVEGEEEFDGSDEGEGDDEMDEDEVEGEDEETKKWMQSPKKKLLEAISINSRL